MFPIEEGSDVTVSRWGKVIALTLSVASAGVLALIVRYSGPTTAADPILEHGRLVAETCTVCHAIGRNDPPRVGPPLWGIVDAPKARTDGFGYSDALVRAGGTWDDASLNAFLRDPQGYLPGTDMVFAGIADERDRASLIAYLRSRAD